MDPQRRDLVKALAAAGMLGIGGTASRAHAAEPAPEVRRVSFIKFPSICQSPVFVAGQLLRAEGFEEVSYVDSTAFGSAVQMAQAVGDGRVDAVVHFAAPLAIAIDRGADLTVLGGVHPGCFELFTTPDIRSVKDLKGKSVAVLALESVQHVFLASIATSVGLDPNRDINWVFHPAAKSKELLAQGAIHGYLGFPPDPQELRAKKVGRMLLSSTLDRPWSQYFCCMAAAGTGWVRKHPIAAKRVMRAILKASEMCMADPDLGVKAFIAAGYKPDAELARMAVSEMPYRRWRDYNPEETLRFYALRLREAGMVKGTPQRIIERGADWRILEELKRELKT
jgi:NitT/TauT family transport system substrate-binding protein